MASTSINMDIADDLPEPRMCAIECPFNMCKKRFVKPIIFSTHLLAHVNYYAKHWPGPFACTICPYVHVDITQVTSHIETLHCRKYRINALVARQLLADNEREKDQHIQLLSKSDAPANPLSLPFNYWD